MKPWLKCSSAAAILALLAACSSGIQAPVDSTLETQATGSVAKRIAASTDDVEQLANGSMLLSGSTLELGKLYNGDNNTVGLRYSDIAIPRNATITKAYLQFVAYKSSSESTGVSIRGIASDNAPVFPSTTNYLTSRIKTSNNVTWEPGPWTVGDSGLSTRTPDISKIVQEVVNRSGWSTGNALAFVVSGLRGDRVAKAFESDSVNRTLLYIEFTTSITAPPPPISDTGKVWVERTKYAINYQKTHDTGLESDPDRQASSGDVYLMGRHLNTTITALIHAYRKTGDRYFIDEVNRLLQLARAKLRDTNNDGYDNWLHLTRTNDPSGWPYLQTDKHEMNEMLAHSLVASAAYALKEAGGYSANVAFWIDYLKNDFERKWRTRKGKPTGIPFVGNNDLTHPELQFVRYFYYMYKLTGDGSYLTNAQAQVDRVQGAFRTSSSTAGTARVWSHSRDPGSKNYKNCAFPPYIGYTAQAVLDLHMVQFDIFADVEFVRSVARNVAHFQIRETSTPTVGMDACGGVDRAGLISNKVVSRGSDAAIASPRYSVGKYDTSGRVRTTLEKLYSLREPNLNAPKSTFFPAMMVSIVN